jgi:hypothetical protein
MVSTNLFPHFLTKSRAILANSLLLYMKGEKLKSEEQRQRSIEQVRGGQVLEELVGEHGALRW